MRFLREQVGLVRVLQRSPGVLRSALVIPFFVVLRGSAVRMGGKIVVFSSFAV